MKGAGHYYAARGAAGKTRDGMIHECKPRRWLCRTRQPGGLLPRRRTAFSLELQWIFVRRGLASFLQLPRDSYGYDEFPDGKRAGTFPQDGSADISPAGGGDPASPQSLETTHRRHGRPCREWPTNGEKSGKIPGSLNPRGIYSPTSPAAAASASSVRRVISLHCPAAMSALSTIQDPPIAATTGSLR